MTDDTISRKEAIRLYCRESCGWEPEKCPLKYERDGAEDCSCVRLLKELPSVQPEQKWIPVTERLPEEDTEVLITYRYKCGEKNTNHVDIDIATYGQMYFGGNKVGDYKHWRAPFEYFESNCDVIAWMPLPQPYNKESED